MEHIGRSPYVPRPMYPLSPLKMLKSVKGGARLFIHPLEKISGKKFAFLKSPFIQLKVRNKKIFPEKNLTIKKIEHFIILLFKNNIFVKD